MDFNASDPAWSVIQKFQVVKFPNFSRAMFHCIGWNKDKPQEVQFFAQSRIYFLPFVLGKPITSFGQSCEEACFVESSQQGRSLAFPLCAGLRGDPMSYYWPLPINASASSLTGFEYDVWVAFREEYLQYDKLCGGGWGDRETGFKHLLDDLVRRERKENKH